MKAQQSQLSAECGCRFVVTDEKVDVHTCADHKGKWQIFEPVTPDPCPFCGDDVVAPHADENDDKVAMICPDCGARSAWAASAAEALGLWNMRKRGIRSRCIQRLRHTLEGQDAKAFDCLCELCTTVLPFVGELLKESTRCRCGHTGSDHNRHGLCGSCNCKGWIRP